MEKQKYYITTAIAYTSGKPHIGNLYEIVLADALARFMRSYGYDVYFQTGTDEHGQKIEDKATAAGKSPQQFVDEISAEIQRNWDIMGASYDKFVRTTDPEHMKIVQKIFKKLYEKGDIYKGEYEGMYCKPCESFFTETQLVDGKCPDCGADVVYAKEEAYFFKLSNYAERLTDYINEHPDFIQPESRKNEMINNFIKPGLKDLCVSRTSFKWGIPVDFDDKHVIYVWIDALSNYITFLGYDPDGSGELYNKYWPADIHLIGKDILRFHTIYWPIMLMALDVPLPKKVFGHPWLLVGEGKMSKSKGNVIYADDLVAEFGLDAIRYYLLKEMPFAQDGSLTYELLIERVNGELVNILGNLVNRTAAMTEKYFGGVIPEAGEATEADRELIELALQTPKIVAEKMHSMHISDAVIAIFQLLRRSNKYIDETTPWALAKNEADQKRLGTVLYNLLEAIRISGVLLSSFLPQTGEKMLHILNTNSKSFESLASFGALESGIRLNKAEMLFERIDAPTKLAAIAEKLAPGSALQKQEAAEAKKPAAKAAEPTAKPQITIDDFSKIELRTGKIIEAKKHPKADKLYIFKVDLGSETRQIISGIAKYFELEELIGKNVVVAANLAPAKLRGELSEGMLLLAENEDATKLSFIAAEEQMPLGSIIK